MANTPHLVRMHEVGDCVQQVIDDLNSKLWAMNQRGHFIEMPEELEFDMIVLKEFEALTSTDMETSQGTETQGGFSKEESSGGGHDITTGKDEKITFATVVHENKGTRTEEFYTA